MLEETQKDAKEEDTEDMIRQTEKDKEVVVN